MICRCHQGPWHFLKWLRIKIKEISILVEMMFKRFLLHSRAYPLQRLLQQRQVFAWRVGEFEGGLGLMRKMNFTTSSGGGSKDSISSSNSSSSSSSEQVLDSKVTEFIQKVS
jgi:hypothetical protein